MSQNPNNDQGQFGRYLNYFGLLLASCAFVYSVWYVHVGVDRSVGVKASDDLITLTVAHWQMEEGAREGWDKAFRQYEKMKAREGLNLRIRQTVVPFRGYRQWFKTQLVGGKPADIVRPLGPDELLNQYFIPLSPFINAPNPYNEGTPLEGMPWRDTIIDGMSNSMNVVYAEYFTVDTASSTVRLFGNLDMIEAATGERKMPETFVEWMEVARKIQAYGEVQQRAIIPITGQIDQFALHYYFSEMNAHLFDLDPFLTGQPAGFDAPLYRGVNRGVVDLDRFFAPGLLLQEMGGLVDASYDTRAREQITFLFYDNRLGFYLTGSWEANSLVQNAPFEVGISQLPSVDHNHKLSKWFTGPVSEAGAHPMGPFGITKATKHPELTLDLLHYMTSYEINQMVMYERMWLPAVRDATYPGLLQNLKPRLAGNPEIQAPYVEKWGSLASRTQMRIAVSRILKDEIEEPGDKFLEDKALEIQNLYRDEAQERVNNSRRARLKSEAHRSALNLGLLRLDALEGNIAGVEIAADESPEERERLRGKLHDRLALSKEGFSRQVRRLLMFTDLVDLIDSGKFLVPPEEQR